MHILGAIAEFERGRIVERVKAGLARAKAQGKRLGRRPSLITDQQFDAMSALSLREAGKRLGVSRSVVQRWRLSRNPSQRVATFASECSQNTSPLA
jgi:putative DNA-invertase from lambdoid prophage Rac